ncbi:phosphoribosylpyrophosphate synthetase [Croceicoccus estronivorus]|uniref:ribose-phosphate diphosphokinase n=1 Tax=Croceicoccus estronivorus TaxID=1172626 RepID=UPI00082A3956|nr:ribose-phosphate diphosphokinase [Croceicoccus estronivorus]OCC25396.1 phosphoribosylpyrophosphate synthetase [Croceicoccus estronivorus]
MDISVFGFPECTESSTRLAEALSVPFSEVAVRRFPDGESLVRVTDVTPTAILYRSLDNPNAKLIELLLAASALRENGAGKVILVAPYLSYMRQDIAFHPGEAVSQRVIGALLAQHFDAVVTMDPHLHRIHDLGEVMPGIAAFSLSAAPALSAALEGSEETILVGPDSESRQWVEAIAAPLGLDVLVGEKERHGDRNVSISIPGIERAAGRKAILVDDVIASGATLVEAAHLLRQAGASGVEALATHCLAQPDDLARMEAAGITRIRSTDSVAGPTASIPTASLLADAIRTEGLIA